MAQPIRDTMPRAASTPARDERSMLILELGVAGFALLACLLLSLAR